MARNQITRAKRSGPPAIRPSDPLTTVYLIRHAVVENPRRLNYGFIPGFHISRRGRTRATHLGRLLARQGVTAIYSSPLERTQETAQALREGLGRPVPITIDRDLRESEISLLWQGGTSVAVPLRFPRQFSSWVHHPERIRFAENAVQMAERVDRVILEAAKAHPGEAIVFVSHATPIKCWAWSRLRRPWSRLHLTRIYNGEGYVASFHGDRLTDLRPFRPRGL